MAEEKDKDKDVDPAPTSGSEGEDAVADRIQTAVEKALRTVGAEWQSTRDAEKTTQHTKRPPTPLERFFGMTQE